MLAATATVLASAAWQSIPPPGVFNYYFLPFVVVASGYAVGAAVSFFVRRGRLAHASVGALKGWVPFVTACVACVLLLFGVLTGAALSVFSLPLLLAGLADLLAALLAAGATTAPWRAAAAIIASPAVALGSYLGLVLASGSYVPPTRWEIPEAHSGWVITAYGIDTCPPLTRDGFTAVVKIDQRGHACTSDQPQFGWVLAEDFYYVSDGQRTAIPRADSRDHPQGSESWVWGPQTEYAGACPAATVFFVLIMCGYALRRWRPSLYAVAVAAAVAGGWALVGPGLSGHAGDPGRGWLALVVDALHLAGAAVWIGGLAHLFVVAAPATASLPQEERSRVRLEIAQRFSRIALASVALIGVTGVGRALWELGAVSQIWSTAYGRTLVIKTALLGALIVLGYLNRRALADFTALRRRVGIELSLLVTLTAAVSLLTDLPPANTASSSPGAVGAARASVIQQPVGQRTPGAVP